MSYHRTVIHRFGSFELDIARAELRAAGRPCPLEPQVFALLAYLVEHRERLVSRDEILEKVWDGRIVSDSAIASRVKSVRKALGDDGEAQRFIKTIHGRGFRFVAEVQAGSEGIAAAPSRPAGSLLPAATSARPSIAVLRFSPVGEAASIITIADALPHDLITELSRLRWLFVTARGSSFRLPAVDADCAEVGRLLDVRYMLTGTVEASGRRLAVTVTLTDARDGRVVWAERYAGPVDEVHAMRAEIGSKILAALEIQIPMHEAAQARLSVTDDLDAWSAYHLGLQHMYRFNRADNALAAVLFGRAATRDPGFARAHAGLSFVHFQNAFMRQTEDFAGEVSRARAAAQRGLDLDPLDPFVNFTMGRSFWLEGDLESGLAWLERATVLSPNYAQGIYARAWTETLSGRGREGREHVDLAMRLSPLDPMHYAMSGTRALAHIAEGEDSDAAVWAERAARSPGAHVLIAMIAAAAQTLAGDTARASAWAANVRQRDPRLGREDFLGAFPMKPDPMRARVSAALQSLGF